MGGGGRDEYGGQGSMGGGMGMPGASPYGGMPGGFGMAPSAPAGGMGAYGGMGGFGGPPASAPPTNDLPFAAAPTSASRTKMPNNGKTLVFDAVPQARQSGQQAAAPSMSAHGPAGPNWNR